MQTNPLLADVETTTVPQEATAAILKFRRDRSPAGRPVQPLHSPWYPRIKLAVDVLLAAILTLPALPIILLAALMVKLTSRGPAFYSQTRVGLNGTPFTIWKLRTMIHNCESLTGARWCVPGDPRVTLVGQFLRISHLDELPQLWNVLRGDMSLVGPRPERPEFVPELERALPTYRQRLNVRPGVTGLAQVQLPPDTDITSVKRKLIHDLYYIQHLSPWLDFKLLVCTAFYAVGVPFRYLSRLMNVPASVEIERTARTLVPEAPPRSSRLSA